MIERHTAQLDATFEVVRTATDHPTAEQVHARVRRALPRVSLGTVYRNLQKLVARGRIHAVHLGVSGTRFDGMLATHEHFVCEHCQAVVDLAIGRSHPDASPLRRAGYDVTRQAVTYFGTCPRCAGRAQARPQARTRPTAQRATR